MKSVGSWIALAVCAALAIFAYSTYNGLQSKFTTVEQNNARIDSALKRHYDLIDNLVNTVRGYAAHERETLQAVIDARSKATAITIRNPEDLSRLDTATGELSRTLSRLMVVSEQYPNLKADQRFADLQKELMNTENQILATRNIYIRSVGDYNRQIRRFPANVLAGVLGFEVMKQFTASETERAAPRVTFGKS